VDINKVIHRKYELLVNVVENQIFAARSACKKSALETFFDDFSAHPNP
jgi:hypothetical protein